MRSSWLRIVGRSWRGGPSNSRSHTSTNHPQGRDLSGRPLPLQGRRFQRSQSLVEFALVAPLLLLVTFVVIDLGRLIYTYNAIANGASNGVRIITLASERSSDADAVNGVQKVANGFSLSVDPNSYYSTTHPQSNPASSVGGSTPPPNHGYIYVFPAVASQGGDLNAATNTPPRPPGQVEVEVSFTFQPLTPLPWKSLLGPLVIKSVAGGQTEYVS